MATDQSSDSNDAIRILKLQHDEIQSHFDHYESAESVELAKQACEKLSLHSAIEEKIFYPACDAKLDEHGRSLIRKFVEAHSRIDRLVSQVLVLKRDDAEKIDVLFNEIIEAARGHLSEEETRLFPLCQTAFGQVGLKQLGDRIAQFIAGGRESRAAA